MVPLPQRTTMDIQMTFIYTNNILCLFQRTTPLPNPCHPAGGGSAEFMETDSRIFLA